MGSYSLDSNMAIDISSPINTAATTHSLDDIRRVRLTQQQQQQHLSTCISLYRNKLLVSQMYCNPNKRNQVSS